MGRNEQHLSADVTDSLWAGTHRFQRLLANQVYPRMEYFDRINPEWRGMDVLDLGCGVGFMAEVLAKRGAHVLGIDPSAKALDAARAHAAIQNLDITYRQGSGEAIPMDTATVDRVVCVDVLEHVQNPERVVAECRRVLRPGGLFFFDTINRNRTARFMVVTLMEKILRIIPGGGHDPQKFIPPGELLQLLERNGFPRTSEFTGMGIVGLDRHLDFTFGLTASTRVMYLGSAR
jgi:2-polyprenyl-6-hydroxyphenyl methylase / 3-demethylubiquinone-9 3-methyltransferase